MLGEKETASLYLDLVFVHRESRTLPQPLSSHQGVYWTEMTDFYIHPFYEFSHKAGGMANMTGLILVVTGLFPVEME